MTDILLIRVNCPDEAVADHIAELLIRAKLAACANIEGPISAVYWWDGEIEREEEWVLFLKAPQANWDKIEAMVTDQHPHETPAILATPCFRVNSRYAQWLNSVSAAKAEE